MRGRCECQQKTAGGKRFGVQILDKTDVGLRGCVLHKKSTIELVRKSTIPNNPVQSKKRGNQWQ
jgi:hypothetical protein